MVEFACGPGHQNSRRLCSPWLRRRPLSKPRERELLNPSRPAEKAKKLPMKVGPPHQRLWSPWSRRKRCCQIARWSKLAVNVSMGRNHCQKNKRSEVCLLQSFPFSLNSVRHLFNFSFLLNGCFSYFLHSLKDDKIAIDSTNLTTKKEVYFGHKRSYRLERRSKAFACAARLRSRYKAEKLSVLFDRTPGILRNNSSHAG